MPVDPQFDNILAMFAAIPAVSEQPIEAIRSAPTPINPAPTPVDSVTQQLIPGPAGDIDVRIYRAGGGANAPLLLFMHGGGFVVGGLDTHDEMARVLTAESGCVTVSVDYRLAPEHPFPAAPDDCFAALKWAAANAEALGADSSRIAVAGDSAGGNLAAVTALKARDEGGPILRAQALLYPVTDPFAPLPPAPDGKYYILTPKERDYYNACYLPGAARASDPYASPAKAGSLKGLCPALVITGEYDPLCAQGEAYAARLREAGVEADVSRYAGAIHGFMSFPAPMGRKGLQEAAEWLKARLS